MRTQTASAVREHWEPGYEVCTFQIHMRRRDKAGRLKSIRSRSVTVTNISLKQGLKIVQLGIEAYKKNLS